jgi:hypothetical protein
VRISPLIFRANFRPPSEAALADRTIDGVVDVLNETGAFEGEVD